MFRRKNAVRAARQPHPDPRIELELQQIIGLQAGIARQEALIAEHRMQLASVREEQKKAGRALRTGISIGISGYERVVQLQQQRADSAARSIHEAEIDIAASREKIAVIASAMDASDLSWL